MGHGAAMSVEMTLSTSHSMKHLSSAWRTLMRRQGRLFGAIDDLHVVDRAAFLGDGTRQFRPEKTREHRRCAATAARPERWCHLQVAITLTKSGMWAGDWSYGVRQRTRRRHCRVGREHVAHGRRLDGRLECCSFSEKQCIP